MYGTAGINTLSPARVEIDMLHLLGFFLVVVIRAASIV